MESNISFGAGAAEASPTVAGAITTAEQVHSQLLDTAAFAERLADVLGGIEPPAATNGPAKDRSPNGVADALNLRVESLRDPATRISIALSRIERRIG